MKHKVLEQLAADENIQQIWLVGSRANGEATIASDHDFHVFGDKDTVSRIAARDKLKRDDIDVLVLTDADNSRTSRGPAKSGSLTKWRWSKSREACAPYLAAK